MDREAETEEGRGRKDEWLIGSGWSERGWNM